MLKKDIVTIGIPQVVICRADVSEDVIYQVMKVIFDHQDELGTFHPEAKAFLENPLESTVIPYHPGVVKYFKEKGLWSANLENKQNKLLQALK
jgi:TRAP transporter TAXI family solute receptor